MKNTPIFFVLGNIIEKYQCFENKIPQILEFEKVPIKINHGTYHFWALGNVNCGIGNNGPQLIKISSNGTEQVRRFRSFGKVR